MRRLLLLLVAALAASAAEDLPQEEAPQVTCPYNGTADQLTMAGKVFADQNDTATAEECLTKAVMASLPAIKSVVELAVLREDFEKAVIFSGVMESLVRNAETMLMHSTALMYAGRYEESLSRLEKLEAANPKVGNVVRNLALAQFNLGKVTTAMETMTRAVKLDESYAEDLQKMRAHVREQDEKEAAAKKAEL